VPRVKGWSKRTSCGFPYRKPHTRPSLVLRTGNPGISLVFGEMWETRILIWVVEEFGMAKAVRWSAVESHISPKTSEMWGTQGSWSGECFGVGPVATFA